MSCANLPETTIFLPPVTNMEAGGKCRIDKWLWAVRLFKTRTTAADAVKGGRVKLNGNTVKAGHLIARGDEISIQKGVVKYVFRVKDIIEKRTSAAIAKEYCEDITPEEEINKLATLKQFPSAFREKGTGRPTKKERRDLDEWMDS